MSKVVSISEMSRFSPPPERPVLRGTARPRTTTDYRRLLTEMRLRPPSQRAFLRKFLKRAAATGVPMVFPVTTHVVFAP